MRKGLILFLMVTLLVGAVTVSGFASGRQEESNTIVFIPKSTSATFYLFLLQGARDKAEELGYEIQYAGPSTEADINAQVDFVRNVAARKPAGILLAALDTEALIPPVEEAIEAGVPVVMVDSGIDSRAPYGNFVTDQYAGGYMAGQEMARILGEEGLVANLGIQAGSISAQRSVGFAEAIAEYPDMEVLETQWTNADAATSLNIASDILTGNPDIEGFFSAAAPIAIGIAQAVKGKGMEDQVDIITFDPSPETLPLFEDGTIDAIIAQDPYQMGYRGVEVVHLVRTDALDEKQYVELPPVLITPENFNQPEIQELVQTPDKFED
jgi:ribose transport system substrate-binding protein